MPPPRCSSIPIAMKVTLRPSSEATSRNASLARVTASPVVSGSAGIRLISACPGAVSLLHDSQPIPSASSRRTTVSMNAVISCEREIR